MVADGCHEAKTRTLLKLVDGLWAGEAAGGLPLTDRQAAAAGIYFRKGIG